MRLSQLVGSGEPACSHRGPNYTLRVRGQPQIAASAKRSAGIRGDVRDKALNALRQLAVEVDAGRFPGLYLLVTGTPAFFDGPSGVQRLAPLTQRLATDFGTDARFDNPRAVQIRLPGFDHAALVALGVKVRDLTVTHQTQRVANPANLYGHRTRLRTMRPPKRCFHG